MRICSFVLNAAVLLAATPALADDAQKTNTTQTSKKSPKKSMSAQMDTAKAMEASQEAMKHITAAQQALDDGKRSAAKSALAKSKSALDRLYKTPPATALVNELDEMVNALTGKQPALEVVDLAPLSAQVSSYQAYLDPEVKANIDEAERRQSKGDRQGAADALRLARNRVAIDLAFLPVEEAYVRVLAAQQALSSGDLDSARSLLRNLPIIVGEMQVSTPLVPVRFKLHAAAEAADAKQWDRTRALLKEANQTVQRLETLAGDAELRADITAIGDDLDRMSKQTATPRADQIRELAKRTRDLGSDDQG